MTGTELGSAVGIPEQVILKACSLSTKAHNSGKQRYTKDKTGTKVFFGFAGSWSVPDWFAHSPFGEVKIDLNRFPSMKSIGVDDKALVNAAFQRTFGEILETTPFQREGQQLVSELFYMPKIISPKDMAITTVQAEKEVGISLRYPMLTATNYSSWAIKMEANMDAHSLWEAIEPVDGEEVDVKKDKLARAYLFGAVPDDVLQQIAKKKTAKEAWESLKVRCLGVDRVKKARVQTLKNDFKELEMNETETVDEFAGKISGLANKMRDLGATMEDTELVKKLLDSVPNKFLQVIAAIEQFSDRDAMPFDEAIGRLKAYEERIRKSEDRHEEHLLLANGASRASGGRVYGKKNGTFDKAKVRCYNCQQYGHYSWENKCNEVKKDEALLTMADEPALL